MGSCGSVFTVLLFCDDCGVCRANNAATTYRVDVYTPATIRQFDLNRSFATGVGGRNWNLQQGVANWTGQTWYITKAPAPAYCLLYFAQWANKLARNLIVFHRQ